MVGLRIQQLWVWRPMPTESVFDFFVVGSTVWWELVVDCSPHCPAACVELDHCLLKGICLLRSWGQGLRCSWWNWVCWVVFVPSESTSGCDSHVYQVSLNRVLWWCKCVGCSVDFCLLFVTIVSWVYVVFGCGKSGLFFYVSMCWLCTGWVFFLQVHMELSPCRMLFFSCFGTCVYEHEFSLYLFWLT